ncbi:MAG: hypothetical protein FJ102_12230 [Deltaproteobacteria bacterium]|nr:hypothetical protein [Deltaproteobacteria bacterium]
MAIHFAETMSGEIGSRPIAFTVRASSEGRGYFRLLGTLDLDGERWPCEGSLRLRPGSIRYRLRFATGRTLAGQKTLSLLHPLRSMTTLPAEVDGEPAELRFDLRDLPAFLWTWLRR